MFPYKIVFSDIDETLLTSRQTVTDAAKAAIRTLEDSGIPFVLVSARMPAAITEISAMIGSHSPVISYSGAMIQDARQNTLFETRLDRSSLEKVMTLIQSRWPGVILNYYAGSSWYVEDASPKPVQTESRIVRLHPTVTKFSGLIRQDLMPHKLLCMGSPKECLQMEEIINQEVPQLFAVRSYPTLLEITDASVNKAAGIAHLLHLLSLDKQDAIAFGDSQNDLRMLQYVGWGVAMGNADDEVKRLADDVALSNNEDGIFHYLKKAGLSLESYKQEEI
ncbi:MAG: Cof-type HAD-IIB family hydrolase [Blautia sp.]|jgi:Cof subfamily protein (haloacid dehalogenase superfamily)